MRKLPRELEEAAIVDGASSWQIVTRVFMPLLGPALVTTGLLAFIAAWNEFLFALHFTLTREQRTVPVAIALIRGARQFETPWGNIRIGRPSCRARVCQFVVNTVVDLHLKKHT